MSARSQRPQSLPLTPENHHKYGSKPLPPPPQRTSMASLFDTPPRRAPKAPIPDIDGNIEGPKSNQLKLETKIRGMRGGFSGPGRRREAPLKLETDRQPSPSVTRLTSPTYHSSDHKINQLMGLDPPARPISNFSVRPHDDEYIVSPLSSRSSYAEDFDDGVSDLDEPDMTARTVRDTSPWPRPLSLQKSGNRNSDLIVDAADLQTSQRSSMARADETGGLRRHQDSGSSSIHLREPGPNDTYLFPNLSPTPPSHRREQSTGSRPKSLSLAWAPKEGFSSRATRSDTRKPPPPPPPERRTGSRGSDDGRSANRDSDRSFGTGNHPLKTPYPPPTMKPKPNKSGWDTDSDDDKEKNQGSKFGAMASKFAKRVKPFGRDNDIVEITSRSYRSGNSGPGGMSAASSAPGSAAGSVVSAMSSGSTGDTSGHPPPREHVILTNRSRDADGPDTPVPQPMAAGLLQRTQGALAGAMKTAGIQSKADRKRENLKGKIRVIPEGQPMPRGSSEERRWG